VENTLQKAFTAAIIATIIALLCGCGLAENNAEKNNVLIVESINVDLQEDKYKLTVQGVNPGGEQMSISTSNGKGGGSGEEAKPPDTVFSSEGEYLSQAFNLLSTKNAKYTLVSHNQIILLGKQNLENRFYECINFFASYNELPIEAAVYGIKNGTAEEVINALAKEDISLADRITNLNDALVSDRMSLKESVLGVVSKSCNGLSDFAIPVFNFEGGELRGDGTAVFSNNKFCGYLDSEETMALLLIKENGRGGVVNTDDIYYKIKNSKTDWNIEFFDNIPHITVNIEVFANVDYFNSADDVNNGKDKEKLKAYLNKKFNEVTGKVLRDYKSDILGFTNRFSFKYPSGFKNYKNNRAELLERAKFEFNIEVLIDRVEQNGLFPNLYF